MGGSGKDLRKYSRGTYIRLIVGGVVLFLVVGNILILLIYDEWTALQSLICMGVFLLPVGLIVLILQVMEWIVKRDRDA